MPHEPTGPRYRVSLHIHPRPSDPVYRKYARQACDLVREHQKNPDIDTDDLDTAKRIVKRFINACYRKLPAVSATGRVLDMHHLVDGDHVVHTLRHKAPTDL